MRYLNKILTVLVLVSVCTAASAATSPGESSAPPLAPLRVESFDKATGELRLSYQSACGATDDTIHYGPLSQVSTLAWSGNDCSADDGFNPGSGSYFFIVAGNDGAKEGSYGRSRFGSALVERAPHVANGCGLTQDLANACTPASMGSACTSNADCGERTACLANATGGGQCACLPAYAGAYCQECAPGYAGADCRSCAPGFVSNAMQSGDTGDRTNPESFRCEPDTAGTCTGVSCGAHGSCVVAGRDALCACEPGYTGADCAQCAPNYQHDPTGACTLGTACREAKCGGHGSCVAAAFGDVMCQCDSGYDGADCGGAPLRIASSSEASTLYAGESVVLSPQGGVPPYTWRLVQGGAQLQDCPARNADPSCPTNSVRVTAPSTPAISDGLLIVRLTAEDGAGLQTAINLATAPSTFLPMSGAIYTELVPFYNGMQKFMRGRGIRAGVLGISKGGVVIATNGYGYRDAGLDGDPFVNAGEGGPIVQPLSPFRIASVTKPMTAAAVRGAAADAGIDITSASNANRAASWVQDSLGFDLVAGVAPYDYNLGGSGTDGRWANVTIQHLLNHHVGFWRDSVLAAAPGLPAYNSSALPFTSDNTTQSGLQNAITGFSNDISYATAHVLAGLQLSNDPRPTVENTILFAAGNTFQYPPGGPIGQGDNYANIGYQLAGRVLEGLKGVTYNPDDPSAPEGWGKFPTLLQDYLCESSGVQTGIYPGDAFHPQAGEPYYRDIDSNGNEVRDWNLAEGDKIRFNNGTQKWEFCQSGCGGPNPTWGTSANPPTAYGGVWLAQRNSAGGLVATTPALLRFARNHRVKVGTPGEGATGIGSLLQSPGIYGSGSSHNGALPGTSSLLWQMGGSRTNRLPQPVGAWELDAAVPLPLDVNGNVRINENTFGASTCSLPSDVAVAAIFNQRQDRRAPTTLNNPAFNATGNSSNGTVYGRIVDFLGDAACEVDADGWPALAEPQAQIQMQCN